MNLQKITWEHFKGTNADNTQSAFEKMCRMLFAYMFQIEPRNLNSSPNNPGIEVHPVQDSNGQRVSFQAKFFSNSIDYPSIESSMQAAVNNYGDCLDVIYLYCNKDLTVTSKSYNSIVKLLDDSNISLELITGEQILQDIIENNYTTIGSLYFNNPTVKDAWFHEQMRLSLSDLGARYNDSFSVRTDTGDYLEVFCNSAKGIDVLNSLKRDAADTLREVAPYEQRTFFNSIATYIEKIPDASQENIAEAFSWFDMLKTDFEHEISEFRQSTKSQGNSGDEYRFDNAIDIIDYRSAYGCLSSQKVLLIDGDAGEGKSHLLGAFGHSYVESGGKAILLLGHKFTNSDVLEKQIVDQLSFDQGFDEFLEILEGIGERDGKYVVILIDAINESRDKSIWHTRLGDVIAKIQNLNFVKLVFSVRSTYEKLVLSDAVKCMIQEGLISVATHRGFQQNIEEAFEMFAEFYNISFAPRDYFNRRLANPLFMTLFCKTYSQSPATTLEVFDAYAKIKDEEIKKSTDIHVSYSLLQIFIDEVSCFFIEKNRTYIDTSDLMSLSFWAKYGVDRHQYISLLEQSNVVHSSNYREDSEIYYFFSYQLMEEYFIAKSLLKKLQDKTSIDNYLRELLRVPSNIRSFSSGVFGILSALYAEKFGEECISILDDFDLPEDKDEHIFEHDIFDFKAEYVLAYSFRIKEAVKKEVFFEFIKKNQYKGIFDNMWDVLFVTSAIEGHPLNAKALHSFLMPMSIAIRDRLWTLHINDMTSSEGAFYSFITKIQSGLISSLKGERAELTSIFFTWLLTSSNRALRDNASEAVIEILKDNFELCEKLLTEFEGVNDSYVLQRLYGCVFGACVKRTEDYKEEYEGLAKFVYQNVFLAEDVFPDILLRDYARLILERFLYEYPERLSFIDKGRICPPYSSVAIPKVEEQSYRTDENGNGWYYIEASMRLEKHGMYGDFGRYVFQSALRHFEDVDLENCFHYAMQYIRDELGYIEEYFGMNDGFRSRSDRHDTAKIERIGKKYQWIAFYNILARISDHHKVEHFWDETSKVFKGPWDPYVRDFDPTLNNHFLKNPEIPMLTPQVDFEYKLDCSIENLNAKTWVAQEEIFFEQNRKFLSYNDDNGNEWILLIAYTDTKLGDYEELRHEMWSWTLSYLVSKKAWINIRDSVLGMDFREGIQGSTYELFNREYFGSPSVDDIIEKNNDDDKVKAQLIPTKISFLWEEEYDASQDMSVSFEMPTKEIVEEMNLRQKKYDGSFYNEANELVVFDTRLSCQEKLNSRGLVIRKDVLLEFLEKTGMEIFWFSFGEKQVFNGRSSGAQGEWSGFYELNSQNELIGKMELVDVQEW